MVIPRRWGGFYGYLVSATVSCRTLGEGAKSTSTKVPAFSTASLEHLKCGSTMCDQEVWIQAILADISDMMSAGRRPTYIRHLETVTR
jgi:hypothetical protein